MLVLGNVSALTHYSKEAIMKGQQSKSMVRESKSKEVTVEDSGLTVLHKTVEEAFLKKDKTILIKFLGELRGVFEGSRELADYLNQQKDKFGNTALHTCYMMYEKEAVRIDDIFQKTRDIINSKKDQEDYRDQYRQASVFAGVIRQHLIEAGLNPNVKNLYGQTAIELCDRGRPLMAALEQRLDEQVQQHQATRSTGVSSSHVARLQSESASRSRCVIL